MSPRSLVFSSSEETSRQLSQALVELELKVEPCQEIFAALKTLTSRAFDVIAVDWDEGLEASFLLKTAREQRTNQSAFTIIMVKAHAGPAVRLAGADLILTKPILAGNAKCALLSCDKLLSRMPTWLPQAEALRARLETAVISEEHKAEALVQAQDFAPHAVTAPAQLTFATLGERGLLHSLQGLFRSGQRTRHSSGAWKPERHHVLLGRAAMVVGFFAVGYVLSQPLSKVGASAAQIYHGTWGTAPPAPPEAQMAAQSAEADSPPPSRSRGNSARIRVLPVYDTTSDRGHPAASASSREPVQAASQAESHAPQAAPARRTFHIPESLEAPFPGVASVRNAAAKLKPALLDAIEPVDVPGYLAEKLLLDRIEPSYPMQALRAGLQGPVVLQAWIGRDGKIRDLKLIRGPLLLGQAACQAVKQWRYKPYLLNGEAVDTQTYVTVDFKLP